MRASASASRCFRVCSWSMASWARLQYGPHHARLFKFFSCFPCLRPATEERGRQRARGRRESGLVSGALSVTLPHYAFTRALPCGNSRVARQHCVGDCHGLAAVHDLEAVRIAHAAPRCGESSKSASGGSPKTLLGKNTVI